VVFARAAPIADTDALSLGVHLPNLLVRFYYTTEMAGRIVGFALSALLADTLELGAGLKNSLVRFYYMYKGI